MIRVISLGAGVQSTTMLLMALTGELERPDCAIFADTQWEPAAVYRHLEVLEDLAREKGFPIYRVSAGHIAKQFEGGGRTAAMPFHMKTPSGSKGFGRRQCTSEFKLAPIHRKLRELAGLKPRQRAKGVIAESWLGISLDEATRMRDSREPSVVLRYPLIEKRLSRTDCKVWLTSHGHAIPPKSACIGCPYRSDYGWQQIKKNPAEWAEAVKFDHLIRIQRGLDAQAFLHASLKPLDEVDLSTAAERGQTNLFENDCESGVCGV